MITIDDFFKAELKVGTVIYCEDVPGSQKLLKLQVDLGPVDVIPAQAGIHVDNSDGSRVEHGMTEGVEVPELRDVRQILSGVKQWYKPEDMVGRQVVVITNLEPRKMMGLESQGMLLTADSEAGPIFLMPSQEVKPGSKIR